MWLVQTLNSPITQSKEKIEHIVKYFISNIFKLSTGVQFSFQTVSCSVNIGQLQGNTTFVSDALSETVGDEYSPEGKRGNVKRGRVILNLLVQNKLLAIEIHLLNCYGKCILSFSLSIIDKSNAISKPNNLLEEIFTYYLLYYRIFHCKFVDLLHFCKIC